MPLPHRLPVAALAAFGAPACAYSFYMFFVQFYFLKFATDVLLLAPAGIGLLFAGGRLWDAVSDPLVGYWSDRTRSRLGRRRPWMLAAIPLLTVSFLMIWRPPVALSGPGLALWSALSLFGFYTAYTIYFIPHTSLGAELATDYHERSRIFGSHRMFFVLGMIGAFGGIGYVTNADDGRQAAGQVALASVLLASGVLLVTPLVLGERADYRGRGAANPWRALRDLWANPHARVLLTAWFLEGIGVGVLGVLSPYVAEYVLGRPELIAVIPAFFVVAGVGSIPVWVVLSRRFGKRNTWLAAMVGQGFFFGCTIAVGEGDLALLCALLVGAGAASGCGGVLGPSMLADTIDWDELQTGERKEGAYSAAWGFAIKLAVSLSIALAGISLQLSGFEANVVQAPEAEWTLRGLFAGMPVLGATLSIAALRHFALGAEQHATIRAELDKRAAAPPA